MIVDNYLNDNVKKCAQGVCPTSHGKYIEHTGFEYLREVYDNYIYDVSVTDIVQEYDEGTRNNLWWTNLIIYLLKEPCWTVGNELCHLNWRSFETQELISGCLEDPTMGNAWCPTELKDGFFSSTSRNWDFCRVPECPIHSRERVNNLIEQFNSGVRTNRKSASTCTTVQGKTCQFPYMELANGQIMH